MHRPTSKQQPAVAVDGAQLPEMSNLLYFGNIISNNGWFDLENDKKINRGCAVFGCLEERVYLNRYLKLFTKMKNIWLIVSHHPIVWRRNLVRHSSKLLTVSTSSAWKKYWGTLGGIRSLTMKSTPAADIHMSTASWPNEHYSGCENLVHMCRVV